MKTQRKTRVTVRFSLILLLSLIACAKSYAQTGSSVIKGCEQAVDAAKVLRVENDGLKGQLKLRDERDALRDKFESDQAEIIVFWKSAATDRKDALGVDDKVEKIRMDQISEYREEINRLRLENQKLRSSRTKWFLAGAIGGILIPKLP